MVFDEVASSLSSEINICYLGDTTLDGPDVRNCVTKSKKICLQVNPSKCEINDISYPDDEFTEQVTTLASDLSGLKWTELADVELLGSTILQQAEKKAIPNKLHNYHPMTHRL